MYFLVRLSRDWVELRSSTTPIQGLRSSVMRTVSVTERRMVGDYGTYRAVTSTRKKKVKLSQTNWTGGKSLGCFHVDQVHRARITKVPPPGFARSISSLMRAKLK